MAALAVMPLAGFLAPKAGILPGRLWGANVPLTESLTIRSGFTAVSIVGVAIGILAWPALGRALLAYGLAARIPVALLMLVARLGNWGTHYDVMRPGVPEMTPALYKWFMIGLLPQMTIWLWFTVVVGGLFGVVAGAIAGRGR